MRCARHTIRFADAVVVLRRMSGVAVRSLLLALVLMPISTGHGQERQQTPSYIVKTEILTRAKATCFRLTSTAKLKPVVYVIDGPRRVVVDANGSAFRLPNLTGATSGGVVGAFRYGVLPSSTARLVMDVKPATRVLAVHNTPAGGTQHLLQIGLTDQSTGVADPCQSKNVLRAVAAQTATIAPPGHAGDKRPTIVIDPGHGGADPGAVVNKVYLEKFIVLAVGRRVVEKLAKAGRYRTVLTRSKDEFVSLDQRIERARAARGDLFISLHADAIEDTTQAAHTSGAAVYILSHKASDAEAKRFAEKENAADRIAGILPKPGVQDGVRNILVDLLKRETERESARLQKLLIGSMRSTVAVSNKPSRSAAFQVLKQTETPAALLELGYMTNQVDLRRMRQAGWQDKMADAIAKAVDQFFRER